MVTRIRRAPPWRMALAVASCTIRKQAVSTAASNRINALSSTPVKQTSTWPAVAAATSWQSRSSAAHRPTSSKALGRSPRAMRRTSSCVALAIRRRSSRCLFTAGSPVNSSTARNPTSMLVSDCPKPSCISRATRPRSSSWIVSTRRNSTVRTTTNCCRGRMTATHKMGARTAVSTTPSASTITKSR